MDNFKPQIQLSELMKDGNAFALIGVAMKAAREAGWTKDQLTELLLDLTARDYQHLLMIIHTRFELV